MSALAFVVQPVNAAPPEVAAQFTVTITQGGSQRTTVYDHSPNMRYGLLALVRQVSRESGVPCAAQGLGLAESYVWIGRGGAWRITLQDHDARKGGLSEARTVAAARRLHATRLWHARHNGRRALVALLPAPPRKAA